MCWWGKWIVEFRRFIHMLDISISNRSLNLNDSFCLFMLRYFHLKKVQKMTHLWLEIGRNQFLCCLLFIAFFTMGYWLIYRCFVLCQRILYRFAQFLKTLEISGYVEVSQFILENMRSPLKRYFSSFSQWPLASTIPRWAGCSSPSNTSPHCVPPNYGR